MFLTLQRRIQRREASPQGRGFVLRKAPAKSAPQFNVVGCRTWALWRSGAATSSICSELLSILIQQTALLKNVVNCHLPLAPGHKLYLNRVVHAYTRPSYDFPRTCLNGGISGASVTASSLYDVARI